MKNLSSLVLGLTLMGGAALSSGAAQADCQTAYTSDAMLGDIQVMATALQGKDAKALKARGAIIEAGLVCLREPMPPALYATVYRLMGVAAFENGELELSDKWFHTALELDPTHEWDITDVAPGTPLFQAYADARRASVAQDPIEGMALNPPSGSTLLIDGRPLEAAAATPDRFHLIQQVSSSNGAVRASWLVTGNEIPAQLLLEESLSRNETKDQEDEEEADGKGRRKGDEVLAGGYTESEVTSIARERPRAKIPLLAAGSVGLLAAGGIYAASFATQTQFNDAMTTDDLLAAQQLTNTLVIASGGALLMGAGVGVWGAVIDDGSTPGLWALPSE
ncbi:MAG: hypothetical protein ACI9VR_005429 [Cognaticolwellia sp.]|jgi:hypothetical protein